MKFSSADGAARYDELVANAAGLVVGLDFDGTLSPIVADPEDAEVHGDAPDVLLALAPVVRAVAVVTGRPAQQALALGLDEVGRLLGERGEDFFVLGQYGNERWSSRDRTLESPEPPEGLAGFMEQLPRILREQDAGQAWVEEKGLAVAVHTRRLDDGQAAFERILGPLRAEARDHDLEVEPGRMVVEVRAAGMHKGDAVRRLVEEVDATAFCFAGDDLGDVEAFKALAEMRADGLPVLLVCSGSEEQQALIELADLVVSGPRGVLDLLSRLTADIGATRA